MSESKNHKIRITVNNLEVEATLNDTEMSHDFISLLPLEFTMKDLFCREKFASLPRSISKGGGQIQSYEVGDIAYWAPGQDIAIFYRQDGQRMQEGLYKLGKIEGDLEPFNTPGSVPVKVECAS
ncbi:MAG TPA: cyclophilin-like fold protein [Balneolaceae bacterium]|nr:cyclophilin-like fold protein [Balneolaceae bacterium]